MQSLVIGISSCLVGNRVRYDGQDKLSIGLKQRLEEHAELLPFCPEVGIGLGVPRPPIQLTDSLADPVARQVDDPSRTFSLALADYASSLITTTEIDGCIVKARSPSCGFLSTPVYINQREQKQKVSGIFTATLQRARPELPIADENIMKTEYLFRQFIQRCLEYREFRLTI